MVSIKSLLVWAAAVLPFVAAVPVDHPGFLKIRALEDTAEVIPGKYIVVFEPSVSAEVVAAHEESLVKMRKRDIIADVENTYSVEDFKGYSISTDEATIAEIAASPEVAFVEPDQMMYTSALRTQTGATWGLGRISHRAPGTTTYIYDSTAGAGTRVYVVDTGIRTTHSQFGGRAIAGANFITTESATDGNGHGTHCAGTIGGSTYGVAKAATIVAVKVLSSSGSGSNSGVIAGMNWVASNAQSLGVSRKSVMSMSLGGGYSAATNNAVNAVYNSGVTVVVAAGNENQLASNVSPASAALAITVGSIGQTDARSSFSNYGAAVDVFAPGAGVLSSYATSDTATATLSGTSMACPHVAGLAAYLIGLEGLASPAAVTSRIKALATTGRVTDLQGSPNLIAYNGNGA
ncbi:Subtilisin-like protein [Glarea lozoyensis ATCC 20868]|uniref:Subtilisin-like protein n=2 Tax=Glarea lozoyensis TaxID=101852 RepID=S3D4L4_GLAL2|nr:Subtilisin-like protein [Glarea lozoyensis ATCC 20868]EHK96957.1 putative Alkaline protease 1 [Glarea lozoyensis 74030]EPE32730.1 Subtilisin-like protein [Glarea lozoyensis ATCC 20868]